MLRDRGIEPAIIEYLHQTPDEDTLAGLLQAIGIPPRDAIRTHESIYARLGLEDRTLTDETLIQLMHIYPILIERPIVETPMGVRICQPPERLLEILPGEVSGPPV